MRILMIPIAALTLLGAAAPASQREDPLKRELGDRVPGKTVDCVGASFVDGPQIVDERTILYRESGRRIWRNDLPEACSGMRPLDTVVIEVWGSQLCRNDRFRAVSPGESIPGRFCRLGKFTAYDLPAKGK